MSKLLNAIAARSVSQDKEPHARIFLLRIVIALLILSPAAAHSQSFEPGRAHVFICFSEDKHDGKCSEYEQFDFQHSGPLAFISSLRTNRFGVQSMSGLHVGWLRPSDIGPLLAIVDSKESCAFVIVAYSSYLPIGHSAVGQQALFLLDGIREGRYPPRSINATPVSPAYDQKSKDEIVRWARQQLD